MPELLKNRYNYDSIHKLAVDIKAVYPVFQVSEFINAIIDTTWDKLELKARMRQIAINLGKYLPTNYAQALTIIDQVIAQYQVGFNDFTLMYFPDFVAVYGQDDCHWDLSMTALQRYTVCSSSEFAVRPFIIKSEAKMMAQMLTWARSDNEHVRRLASEGCRPQLPWGQALGNFKTNPGPILPILEQLKTDSALYVRKSVANNLNDISKTHPNLVVKIANDWYGKNQHTDWIVRHGCRTLLKQGNRQVLDILGFADGNCLNISDFVLKSNCVLIGTAITFSFLIEAKQSAKIRLEYAIDYVKANGKRSPKIFQISELFLKANTKKFYTKKHDFVNVSTRKLYPGVHSLTLIVNGNKQGTIEFTLLPANK